MRPLPRRWHEETWICSLSGHVAPAAHAASLAPGDAPLGTEEPDGTRLARCLRCDLWLRVDPPSADVARWPTIPPLDELDLPLRGEALHQRLVLRLIVVERLVHVALFTTVAVVALVLELRIGSVRGWADDLLAELQRAVANSGRAGGHRVLVEELDRLADLRRGELWAVFLASAAYAVLESVESVGLWRGRRWAEYLTVVATAGLLPLEVHELLTRPSALKAVALVVNLAILVWLVWAKRLFGLRGGAPALEERTDWAGVLADVRTADAQTRLATTPGGLSEPAPEPEPGPGAHAPRR